MKKMLCFECLTSFWCVINFFLCKIPLKVLSVRNCSIVGHVVVFF